jgi:hypothetical protein
MGFVRDITGATAARGAARDATNAQVSAGREAIDAQERAAARGQEFLAPFAGSAERGVQASSFLANPQEQFEFLQSNPLFQLGLDNANQVTEANAASRGRLSAGDTLQQLYNNVLLQAQPLIDRQRQDISSLLNLGTGIATSQANIETGKAARVGDLTTNIGATQAAGIIGMNAARPSQLETAGQAIQIGSSIASAFSDPRLKSNIKNIGKRYGYNWYSWTWNSKANGLGLFGNDEGVLSTEVPHAVIKHDSGYDMVNYGAL